MTDIHDIMKDLDETLCFANNHEFHMINLELVAIQEAQWKIEGLYEELPESMASSLKETVIDYLTKMKEKGSIFTYAVNDDGSIEIIPMNKAKYDSHPIRSDYYLTLPKNDDNIIA